MSLDQTIATIAAANAETLGFEARSISSERATSVVHESGVQTTTEMLLLLARFHSDVEDTAGAQMLAEFAERFAVVEATVV